MSFKDGKRGLLSSVNHSLSPWKTGKHTASFHSPESNTHTHKHRKWHLGHKTWWECTDITSDYVSFSL